MLFNSYQFIFLFLPATLAGFFLLGRASRGLAFTWLIAASILFYAWWRPINVLIMLPSILVNWLLARWLLKLRAPGQPGGERVASWVLALGIVFNIAFLGYFKYVNFIGSVWSDVTGASFVLTQVILPLGISFITFQKIAFLVDVHARRVTSFTLRDFGLFVMFFPQLIAGPIVHFREVMPQFQKLSCRYERSDVSVGLTLFIIGLFKKVVLADGIAEHVSPIYQALGDGGTASFFPAWFAALGFTLQIYFDFSGYSDMAVGLARCFGVRLPPNFDSPLRASNIIDFWLRWHMTLTRFLTAYLYNPVVLWLTRRRMSRGLPIVGGRSFDLGAFVQMLALPTIFTMLVSGIWHGAGYLFIAWGLVHGIYLVVNHAWRALERAGLVRSARLARWSDAANWPLTLLCVVVAMVLFRAPDWAAAKAILRGMIGLDGLALPQALVDQAARVLGSVPGFVQVTRELSATSFAALVAWTALLGAIALGLPNSLRFLQDYEPALGFKPVLGDATRFGRIFRWRPTVPWGIAISALAVASVLRLSGKSEFLYWQF